MHVLSAQLTQSDGLTLKAEKSYGTAVAPEVALLQ